MATADQKNYEEKESENGMKILQVLSRFPWPLKDGGALGYYNFSKGYADAGCELTMASLNTAKHLVDYSTLPDHVKNMADIHLSYIDNRLKPMDALMNLVFSRKSYHVQRFISRRFARMLAELCKRKQYDVVIFESIFVAPYLSVIRKHSNAVCILRCHNVEHEIWQNLAERENNQVKKYYLNVLYKRLKRFEESVFRHFDGITTVTAQDAMLIRQMGFDKTIHVAPTGMDISRLTVNHAAMELPSLLHLGSMDWRPNQEAVLWFIDHVWDKVSEYFPDLKFYIAGRNMPPQFFDLNRENIVVLGEVEDAVRLMQEKAVVVVPLFSGSGIRVKILEGMALGKCIVSTPLGARGIDVSDTHNILIAHNEDEFAEKIIALFRNPSMITQIGNNARQLVEENYESSMVIRKTLDYYRSLA